MKLVLGENGVELVHPAGNWHLKHTIGYSPVEALVASVAACSIYVYKKILENSGIDFELVDATVSYERDADKKAQPVSEITINFEMKVAAADQKKTSRALRLIAPNCPVIQTLDASVVVEETVSFVD
ncbi:MAG: OsmC family protein [Lactococcus sp.]|uniref:Peroxiredoxin, OsmC family protein n=1 Tax=Pseudolactococcus piscium MKFS47 TaxID=297352 RepID=A0A0D6DWG1_9LACT|nr:MULTISPECIES: OsmC family protein [Lactococcus]MCJ1972154.1 OsmC family protein [Lactococcus carnosus]MDN5404228.1 OsmC family protein [Lactococcus sp.]MDN5408882.1 OsmC family protein [Lactococcus sp.]MDN5412718.1 OsmC family protein [Lactococcus sp.]MDN5435954.1 OsmC family protein [Lactococcus sp.]